MQNARAFTFDCWNTLLYAPESKPTYARRVERVAAAAREIGFEADASSARAALDAAWRRHTELWHAEVASGAPEMAVWALEALADGAEVPEAAATRLAEALARETLAAPIHALDGARELLAALAGRGIRRALICDTGLSGGDVVRQLLDREGLLEHLEVTIFSNEVGVPKPRPRPFSEALSGLGLSDRPDAAVHVGDLLRTDVAGARAAGMGTVRIRDRHDDPTELPEADHVVDSLRDLMQQLGLE